MSDVLHFEFVEFSPWFDAFDDWLSEGVEMRFGRWLNSFFTQRGHALAHYRSAMKKAGAHDYVGAIADYSLTIDGKDTPNDIRAMATYNRALAYSAIKEDGKAARDLEAVLRMPGVPKRIETAALRRVQRVRQRDLRNDLE